jgi:hypothetical protein
VQLSPGVAPCFQQLASGLDKQQQAGSNKLQVTSHKPQKAALGSWPSALGKIDTSDKPQICADIRNPSNKPPATSRKLRFRQTR